MFLGDIIFTGGRGAQFFFTPEALLFNSPALQASNDMKYFCKYSDTIVQY